MEVKNKKVKYINLDYLNKRTKSNPALIMEMISLYLEQTPSLIVAIRESWENKDWQLLYAAAHKTIPSFAIMGINVEYENMAKKIQEYANTQQQSDASFPKKQEISDMIMQLENVFAHICKELEDELIAIKNNTQNIE